MSILSGINFSSKDILVFVVVILILGGFGIVLVNNFFQKQWQVITSATPSPVSSVSEEASPSSEVAGVATSPTPKPTVINPRIAYSGTYIYLEQSSQVTLNIPRLDGNITGSVSGACTGPVEGRNVNNKISGSANGTCKIAGVDIPSTATYEGSVDFNAKKTTIYFKGQTSVGKLEDSMLLFAQ